jgi:hypothetical protein
MPTQFPIRYTRDIPRTAAEDVYRNFAYLAKAIDNAGQSTFDAIVDPTLTANNTSTRQFKTVFAAVQYVADTLGITDMTIGVRNTTTTIVETGNYGGSTNGLTVHIIGFGGNFAGQAGSVPNGTIPLWDMHLFHENSKWANLIVGSLFVQKNGGTVTPTSTFFNNAALKVFATDSVFDGQGASSTTVTCDIAQLTAVNSVMLDVGNASGAWTIRDSIVTLVRPTNVGWAGTIIALGCQLNGPASNCTLTLSTTGQVIFDGVASGSAAAAQLTVTISAAKQVSFKTHATNGVLLGIALNITSGSLQQLVIEGFYNEITTLSVPTTNTVGRVSAVAKLRADITGPMNVDMSIGSGGALTTYGLRIRGTGVNGSVVLRVADTASAATVLDYIAAKRSVLTASIMRDGATSTGCKAFAFDASSANNILILEQDALGAASTDAGANDLVITDATFGSSPTSSTIDKDFTKSFMLGGMQR